MSSLMPRCSTTAPSRPMPAGRRRAFSVARSATNQAAAGSAASEHQQQKQQSSPTQASRRDLLLSMLSMPAAASALAAGLTVGASPAQAAYTVAPEGYRLQVDKIDGYSFFVPESWLLVTSSGNDVFFRNTRNVEENLFVDITSPSSSRYKSVTDLGTPKDAANKLLDQFLTKEFMSTRLGIARYGEVVSASSRVADDGATYYDIAIRMTSYSSRNPYVASRQEVLAGYGLEWDRTLSTVMGVANDRLYELRLQTPTKVYEARKAALGPIMESFRVRTVEAQ